MLKNLDPLLVPELLLSLAQMGHADIVAVVDKNFPAHTRGGNVVELPGVDAAGAVAAILSVLPLEAHAEPAVIHMLTDEGGESPATPKMREIWNKAEGRVIPDKGVGRHGDEGFYALADDAYVTVRTGEDLPYACYLLIKGTL
ncbi:MAG: hypothetical protein LBU38_06165 [Propionibacteriaceae bacterium]|jgi:L-fucose mutarotase|nr:hypothetical protein [Propionibacteriaceae bacterium]